VNNQTLKGTVMRAQYKRKEMKKLAKMTRECYPGSYFVDMPEQGVTFFVTPSCRGNGHISWSICGEGDKYDKWIGRCNAAWRMEDGGMPIMDIPIEANNRSNGAIRYFQNLTDLINWPR
jgi:hypothetical protein